MFLKKKGVNVSIRYRVGESVCVIQISIEWSF